SHQDQFAASGSIVLAITLREDGTLAGAIGLDVEPLHRRAELGYWVGLDYWGRGYCTEAALALVRHGFETMGLHRILAHHFSRNPASGRVMQKKIGRASCRERVEVQVVASSREEKERITHLIGLKVLPILM